MGNETVIQVLTMFQITNSVMPAVNTYPNYRFTVSMLNLVVFDFAALCMMRNLKPSFSFTSR